MNESDNVTNEIINREAWIATAMLSDFKNRVSELNKRAAKLKCEPIVYEITDDTETRHVPAENNTFVSKPSYNYEVTKVNIRGKTPVIPGFKVVAKIDHDSELDTNIIMEFRDYKLPDDYRHKNGDCEHCNVKRQRNKTYVLSDDNTGKLSQVGSSCLKDFTGHSNPEYICNIQEFVDDSLDELCGFGTSKVGYVKVEPFLDLVSECMLRNGYISAKKAEELCVISTADEVMELYIDKNNIVRDGNFVVSTKAKELSSNAINYIKSLNRNDCGNYVNNVISFVDNGIIKDKYYRMLSSAIVFYENEQFKLNKIESNMQKKYIGEIGIKTRFEATFINQYQAQNDFGVVHINKFNDNEGNNITWFSAMSPALNIGDKYEIEATIKSHDIFNNEPQTTILRPKFKALNDELTEDSINTAKEMSHKLNAFKADTIIGSYQLCWTETYKSDPEMHEQFQYGMGNIVTYLNPDQKDDKIKKCINSLNAHQILLLAATMQKTGFAVVDSSDQTKQFFKIHENTVLKIVNMYPVIKQTKTKHR